MATLVEAPKLGHAAVQSGITHGSSIAEGASGLHTYMEVAERIFPVKQDTATLPDLAGEPLRVVAWSDHEVSGFGVSAVDMREGWMANLYAFQGKRPTWFTASGVAADFTPILWKFNDDHLWRMVKAM